MSARPVSRHTDAASKLRSWRIDGFAEVAGGGTHPANTREVGEIRLQRRNVGKSKERIEICVGEAPPTPPITPGETP